MIKTFRLRNFKAFEDTGNIELKPITVLAGTNSGGKSSILQSLLLLKQTLDSPADIAISLDGKYLQYSSFSDLTFGKPHVSRCNITYTIGVETPIPRAAAEQYFDQDQLPNTSDRQLTLGTTVECPSDTVVDKVRAPIV